MRTTSIIVGFLFARSLSFQLPVSLSRRLTLLEAAPPVLSLDRLTCSHDGGNTFQVNDVSYHLPRGAKVCLVGRNGAGKSTLLKILAEKTGGEKVSFSYSGQVTSLKTVRVAMVEQEPLMPSDITVADALLGILDKNTVNQQQDTSVYGTVRRYIQASTAAAEHPEAFAAVTADMDRQQGWAVLTKAEEVATRLRVRHLQEKALSQLSGGERKRVALAAALVQEPDVLLLDEPTNFLSLAGVQWLEELLADPALTILMVTHDRVFLDQVCDRILELDQGKLYEYVGKYADYLTAKEERLARDDAAIQSAKAKYRVELDWMRRQPQARQTKSKTRIDAFYKLEKSTKPRPRKFFKTHYSYSIFRLAKLTVLCFFIRGC
jgi:ATP-binding cassette subfamily F protein uup